MNTPITQPHKRTSAPAGHPGRCLHPLCVFYKRGENMEEYIGGNYKVFKFLPQSGYVHNGILLNTVATHMHLKTLRSAVY